MKQPRETIFRRRLLRWFDRYGRSLPWRRTRDPYKILVSEVMLQQTQVDRVKEFYRRFLKRYPTVRKLAKAESLEVRETWEGLGYYRRAHNLHKTSQAVVQAHQGKFPDNVETLMSLPGVGRYTAGAVASFAFNRRAPILDTNVSRVLRRVFGVDGDPKKAKAQKALWHLAEVLLPRKKIWEFNQGIMDFGATICTARKPQCESCPMSDICDEYASV
jgi:A/G-specific adenine glycosylase